MDALRSEVQANQGPSWMRSQAQGTRPKHDAGEWKAALTELLVASLNRAKKELLGCLSICWRGSP